MSVMTDGTRTLATARFIGVDLGWTSGATGLSCLEWNGQTLHIRAMTCELAIANILAWIESQLDEGSEKAALNATVIAVDAPTLIPNATGMRVPDRLAHKYFRRYHAGCYPANLGRPFAQRTVDFGLKLESMGFRHQPHLAKPQSPGRYQLEVFPHAAIIHLFQLNQILKYKKGRLAERRTELLRLRKLMRSHLPQLTPALCLPESTLLPPAESSSTRIDLPDIPAGGRALKAIEDQVDSLICAYVAAHWWYWGQSKNWILGDRTTGYIVVPTPFGRLGVD